MCNFSTWNQIWAWYFRKNYLIDKSRLANLKRLRSRDSDSQIYVNGSTLKRALSSNKRESRGKSHSQNKDLEIHINLLEKLRKKLQSTSNSRKHSNAFSKSKGRYFI